MIKRFRYFTEGIFVKCAFWFFGRLSLEKSSAIGGFFGRHIGPLLSRTKVARKNLKQAMPALDDKQLDIIIKDMWDNLGRVFCEFPHIVKFDKESYQNYVSVSGEEHINEAKQAEKGSLFFSGHFANWELVPKTFAIYDCPLTSVYRQGNNPVLDKIIQQSRGLYQSEAVPKGSAGSRQLVRALKEKRHVGMLIDQKVNTGIPVKFFGRDAMTSEAIAVLALRFNSPIIPTKIMRTQGPYHQVTFLPPLEINKTGDDDEDVLNIMTSINAIMEEWVRENPAQWIWIHNRWPKED